MIRTYNYKDKEAVLNLLKLNTPKFFAETEAKDFANYLTNEVVNYFVYVSNNKIIGAAGINYFNKENTARLSWDLVHPKYHNKGIGKKLLQNRLAIIKSHNNINKIVVRTSQLAFGFYIKNGFKLVKIEENYWAPDIHLYQMEYVFAEDKFLFTTERLGFRKWQQTDLEDFAKINANEQVMEHFPKPLTKQETKNLIVRMQSHYIKHGFTYFALEELKTKELIGFIGLAMQTYQSVCTPAIDIGWRLKTTAWGKGYATEGAKKCLELAFNFWGLKQVISTCTIKNSPSENVMKKIGMTKMGTFLHPKLADYPSTQECIWYQILKH